MQNERPNISYRIIYQITKIINHIASIILFMMTFLTVCDVSLRKILSKSILGTVELSEFMMVIIVFFSLAQTEFLDGHIRVDLIMKRVRENIQITIETITQLICCILFAIFALSTFKYFLNMKLSQEVSQDLWIPKYPFILIATIGFALLSLVLFIKFIKGVRRMKIL